MLRSDEESSARIPSRRHWRIVGGCFLISTFLLASYCNFLEGIPGAMTECSKNEYVQEYGNVNDVDSMNHILQPTLFINDRTILLDPTIRRPWLFNTTDQQPPYKIILTDIGWNHPNMSHGLKHVRWLRSRELLQGMLDHPNFDPTISWSDVVKGKHTLDPDTRFYVFLDVETCFEGNYPVYGPPSDQFLANIDVAGGRAYTRPGDHPCFNVINCHYIDTVLQTIYRYPKATLVVYNCRGWGPGPLFRKEKIQTKQLSLVSESTHEDVVNQEVDIGLTPGPLNVVSLTTSEIEAINSCNDTDRPFLVTFIGAPKVGGPRAAMIYNMSNGRDVIFMSKIDFRDKYFFLTFHESLKKSVFGAAPKGDNFYSYRFTEVLSAGSIPVVHADGWVMPFHKALFDWNETCAIVIPEAQVYETERILRSISKEERCRRQRNCLEIYQKYFATPQGTVAGIVESLEKIHGHRESSALQLI